MSDRLTWNTQRLEAAQKILAGYPASHYDIALARMGEVFNRGKPVTSDSIEGAFRAAGLATPRSYMNGAPADAPKAQSLVQLAATRNATARAKAAQKELVEELQEAKARQAFLDAIPNKPVVLPRRERLSRQLEACPVVLASDWHIGESVTEESVGGLNKFNLKIADRRVQNFFEGVRWLVEHHRADKKIAIRDLVLWLGGDLMTGFLHPDQRESNNIHPTEEIIWLTERLHTGIHRLTEDLGLNNLQVVCSHGNHGRTTEKMQVNTSALNSFEWLMYAMLKARETDERIKWTVTKSDHQYVEVYGFKLHFHHGHEVKSGGGVGGIGIPLLKIVARWNEGRAADYHHIGHHHQLRIFNRAFVNGSLIGSTPYGIKFGHEEPEQLFYLLDSRRGATAFHKLWVADETTIDSKPKR